MTPEKLMARLNAQEDSLVERKSQGIKARDIRKTAAAFANLLPEGQYGVIYIGMGDKGVVEGCDNSDAVQKRVREAANDCYPPIMPQCVALKVDGKDVVAVVVSASRDKPHFTGPAYARQGSESVKASKLLFDEMVAAPEQGRGDLTHARRNQHYGHWSRPSPRRFTPGRRTVVSGKRPMQGPGLRRTHRYPATAE